MILRISGLDMEELNKLLDLLKEMLAERKWEMEGDISIDVGRD